MRQRSGSPKASRPIFCSNYAWLLSPTAAQLHHLWRSFALRALPLGENLSMMRNLLGHNKIDATSGYAHLAGDWTEAFEARVAQSNGGDILDRTPRQARVSD